MVLEACITCCIIILREMRGAHQGDRARGDRTEGGKEGKGGGGKRKEGGGGEILVEERTGGPNKGSTRGLRGPKNTKERVALEKKLYYV